MLLDNAPSVEHRFVTVSRNFDRAARASAVHFGCKQSAILAPATNAGARNQIISTQEAVRAHALSYLERRGGRDCSDGGGNIKSERRPSADSFN